LWWGWNIIKGGETPTGHGKHFFSESGCPGLKDVQDENRDFITK
jgi:hypothetical protein